MLIYLLPPSEGKQTGGVQGASSCTFSFELPLQIASSATEKDLKCSGKRYEEGIFLNKSVINSPTLPAIQRYSGVMWKALGYEDMSASAQEYVDAHVLICSGMYGLLCPQDTISNYKLPIDTKELYAYWKKQNVTESLAIYAKKHNATLIDLLPGSYKKMIDRKILGDAGVDYIQVNFYKKDIGGLTKYTHGVKKVKGKWLRGVCEAGIDSLRSLGEVADGEIQIIT